jgi:hypothetical protein
MLTFVLALGGCLGDDDDAENATPGASADGTQQAAPTATPVTADGVLTTAAERWSGTNSAHFNLEVDGEAFLDDEQTIALRSAEGDILRPDSVSAKATVSTVGLNFSMEMIAIGNEMWMTSLIQSGRWEEAPSDFGYNPAVLFSEEDGIGPVLTEMQSPELEDEEQVEGRDAHVVSGTVAQDAIDTITAGAIATENVPVTVWIDTETSDILKVVISGATSADAEESTWTLLVTDHDDPVEIEPPQLDS